MTSLFRRLLDGQVRWLGTSQYLVHVTGGASEVVGDVWAIGHEAARLDELFLWIHAGKAMLGRQGHNASPLTPQKRVRDREHRGGAAPARAAESPLDFLGVSHFDHVKANP